MTENEAEEEEDAEREEEIPAQPGSLPLIIAYFSHTV